MRTIINPTFSPYKLKEVCYILNKLSWIVKIITNNNLKKYFKLVPLMKLCSDRLLNVIQENLDKELNITEYIKLFIMIFFVK